MGYKKHMGVGISLALLFILFIISLTIFIYSHSYGLLSNTPFMTKEHIITSSTVKNTYSYPLFYKCFLNGSIDINDLLYTIYIILLVIFVFISLITNASNLPDIDVYYKTYDRFFEPFVVSVFVLLLTGYTAATNKENFHRYTTHSLIGFLIFIFTAASDIALILGLSKFLWYTYTWLLPFHGTIKDVMLSDKTTTSFSIIKGLVFFLAFLILVFVIFAMNIGRKHLKCQLQEEGKFLKPFVNSTLKQVLISSIIHFVLTVMWILEYSAFAYLVAIFLGFGLLTAKYIQVWLSLALLAFNHYNIWIQGIPTSIILRDLGYISLLGYSLILASYLLHIIADLFTGGVYLLYPLKKQKYGKIKHKNIAS